MVNGFITARVLAANFDFGIRNLIGMYCVVSEKSISAIRDMVNDVDITTSHSLK